MELGNKEQALAAYQKAIEISPNQPTAWQGLAQFHEKQSANYELVSVYCELVKIFQDEPIKFAEYSFKMANVLIRIGKFKNVN